MILLRFSGRFQKAQDDEKASRASNLSVSAQRPVDQPRQPGLGHGYHLHSDGAWIRLSDCVMDWFSRRVLSHRISITMNTSFCLDALEEAIDNYGKPEIMNTDQGSQLTSLAFTQYLKDHDIRICMDGKSAWRDTIFVERLWRTVKYEQVYLHAYESTREAKSRLAHYSDFYNRRRPHPRLDRQTPDQDYFNSLT